MKRVLQIPQGLEIAISAELQKLQVGLQQSKLIADHVLRLSDFYIKNPSAPTPWTEKWTQIAYLAYYLPLNFLRNEAIHQELQKLYFYDGLNHTWDFGSGLGSGSLSLWVGGQIRSFEFIERSTIAQNLHQGLIKHFGKHHKANHKTSWDNSVSKNEMQSSLGLFSYSLTELEQVPKWAMDLEALLIIEPSTQSDGRSLLKLREELLKKDFYAWAPCTHQQACPLLLHSKTDWCHDRIHFDQPEWFKGIENHLPIKNRTLTMSYLALRKKYPPDLSNYARLTGDQLVEKGKTRQLICRGDQREFLSWLHRDGEVQDLPRGILIETPKNFESKSNELRVKEPLTIKI